MFKEKRKQPAQLLLDNSNSSKTVLKLVSGSGIPCEIYTAPKDFQPEPGTRLPRINGVGGEYVGLNACILYLGVWDKRYK